MRSKNIMVTELKEVISTLENLKDEEQREIASLLQEELNWNQTLEKSHNQLNILAEEALDEYKSGKTKETDW